MSNKRSRHQRAPKRSPRGEGRRLEVWAVRREQPDWDRFVAVMVALALKRIEQQETTEGEPEGD